MDSINLCLSFIPEKQERKQTYRSPVSPDLPPPCRENLLPLPSKAHSSARVPTAGNKHTERFLFQDLGLPLDFMSLGSPKYKTQSFAFFSVVQDTEMNRGSKKYKMQLYPKPQ